MGGLKPKKNTQKKPLNVNLTCVWWCCFGFLEKRLRCLVSQANHGVEEAPQGPNLFEIPQLSTVQLWNNIPNGQSCSSGQAWNRLRWEARGCQDAPTQHGHRVPCRKAAFFRLPEMSQENESWNGTACILVLFGLVLARLNTTFCLPRPEMIGHLAIFIFVDPSWKCSTCSWTIS